MSTDLHSSCSGAPDAAALVRCESFARAMFEQAADGIFVADERSVFVDVNPSGHRLLGYDPGELIGRTIADLTWPDDVLSLAELVPQVQAGAQLTLPWRFKRKDGSLLEAEVRTQALADGHMLGVVRDATARLEAERRLRASEAHLRSVLQTAQDFILTLDPQGTILDINRTLPHHTREGVIGTRCYDYAEPDEWPRMRLALTRVFEQRSSDTFETPGPLEPSGERRWLFVRAGPLFQGDRVVAAILCCTDITALKQEAARGEELLQRLEKLATRLPGVVYQYKLRPDGSHCFPYASQGLREIFRVDPDDVREDGSAVFARGHPDDMPLILSTIQRSAATLEPWQHEFRVRHEDGTVRWLYGDSIPERQADGSFLWHGFITDITARKEADERRAQLEAQLLHSQRLESIGRLAGGVAHDFNNLLTSVLGFAELAKVEAEQPAAVREHAARIMDSARWGAQLTQQLLAFARKRIVKPELVDLNGVLARMAPMIHRLLGEDVCLTIEACPGELPVTVDRGSIEQVVVNLAVNARDAMPEGGTLTLRTLTTELAPADPHGPSGAAAGPWALLSVRDTGTGLSPEAEARLFEPFFTTKPPGRGTGLGLAVCHGVIQQASGHIVHRSQAGCGATFEVWLPLRAAAAVSHADGSETGAPAAPAARETVLLVEDDPSILEVGRQLLGREGYDVLVASDGVAALELVAGLDRPLHALVTDVVMPRMGGRELATTLQAERPELTVLFTSGHTEDPAVLERIRAQGNFLHKPYSPAQLVRTLRELLDRAAAARVADAAR